jgi:hypothetical protein
MPAHTGLELEGLGLAKLMAEEALLDFAEDEMLDGDRRYFVAIVKDEARQEVLRVTLSLAEEGLF